MANTIVPSKPAPHTDDKIADLAHAMRVCRMIQGFYPNQEPKDPETYLKGLAMLCTGAPKALLRTMVDPVNGIMRECRFLPGLAEVSEWLEKRLPRARAPEHRPFRPELPAPEVTEEERTANLAKLERVKKQILAKMTEPTKKQSSSLTQEQLDRLEAYIADPLTP